MTERPPTALPARLSVTHRNLIFEEWNATAREYPRDRSLGELFDEQVCATPGAVAVVWDGGELSYEELNARANGLAQLLVEAGVKPGDRVALALERSAELVIAELAVVRCGAAYVPLDDQAPSERVAFVLMDCAARVVVSRSGHELPQGWEVKRVDVDGIDWSATPSVNPRVDGVNGESIAYVMYTSGSTGQPKGVMVPHRAVTRLVRNNGYAEIEASDRVAFASNPAFDATTLEVWGPLLNGAGLVVIERESVLAEKQFAAALVRHGVTVLWMTVGLFNQYAEGLREELGALRYLLVGGDALDPRVMARVMAASPRPQHVLNGYGPTETTTFALTYELGHIEEGAKSIPIGNPIGNTRVYILDPNGEPVPIGVEGEIHIGGDGVAQGYLNRPELTAEKFVRDPFVSDPQARMYRSGDLGRWLPDGNVEFLGRNDQQVKVRGFRVELGEIEARLQEHVSVREAVVLAREDEPGAKRLVAYVVARSGQRADAQELREHLVARLPEYMVPAAYVDLEALPLTANGKVDRRALPAPGSDAYAQQDYEAPATETEAAVAAIWCKLLGLERVGRNDNFLALGGDSLASVRVINRIRQQLGAVVSVTVLLGSKSLADLARAIEEGQHEDDEVVLPPPLQQAGEIAEYRATAAQQQVHFFNELRPGNRTYQTQSLTRIAGPLDVQRLRDSLARIVARHEHLRSTYHVRPDGTLVGRVHPAGDPSLALVDLSAELPENRDAALERETRRIAEEVIDPSQLPLARWTLFRLAHERHALFLVEHHYIHDGWSFRTYLGELAEIYTHGTDAVLRAPLQFREYVEQHARRLTPARTRELESGWSEYLQGFVQDLVLPVARTRHGRPSHAGGQVRAHLPAALADAVRDTAARLGVTSFQLLFTAFGLLLGRYSSERRFLVGSTTANRTEAAWESVLGMLVNTIPVAFDWDPDEPFAALVGKTGSSLMRSLELGELPFPALVAHLAPARSAESTPLVQIAFSAHNAFHKDIRLGDLGVEIVEACPNGTAKLDLNVICIPGRRGEPTEIVFEYATDLFDRATVERLIGHYRNLLEAALGDPRRKSGELPLIDAAERRQVLYEWNATGAPTDGLSMHEAFEAQVLRTPDAVAIVDGAREVSYRELNAQANRLAHHLRSLGVRTDARVGIAIERSIEMIAGLLAVLKAGGAYVPIDPRYPRERLHFMIGDSAPVAVVVHTRDGEEAALPPLAPTIHVLDFRHPVWEDQPDRDPLHDETRIAPHDLAYVIYTSGSTGRPKGVMIEHAGLSNYLQWAVETYRPAAGSIVSSSLSFDATITSLTPLLCGGVVRLVADGDEIEGLEALLAQPSTRGLLKITPSHLLIIADELLSAGKRSSIDLAVVGGEALSPAVVRAWRSVRPDGRIVNEYGPTETVVGCVVHWVPETIDDAASVPIGRPIANMRIYVLDDRLEPVPIGVPGEIFIAGRGVARAYLNQPELTAQRFLREPFVQEPGARMYRSGDLGRYRPDGTIEFLGRADFQVKIRGFRIEPGEIEARLLEHPAVREAVVVAREDGRGEKQLVAYVVPAGSSPAELRGHLAAHLPDYMIPASYVFLEALPRTVAEKIDRKALPRPDRETTTVRAYEAPEGEVERLVAEIWADVLGVDRVGRQDDFFELGGHSLLAVKGISRLRQLLGIEVGLAVQFDHPVLADFARHLTGAERTVMPPIERATDRGMLSFAQQRLWFLAQLEGSGSPYHTRFNRRLLGALDVARLRQALDALVVRHEVLRTTFHESGGEPIQRITPAETAHFALEEHDLRGRIDAETERKRLIAEEANAPFDLERGPLIRGRFIRAAEHDFTLLITQHHIISDAWSMNVLLRELGVLYAGLAVLPPAKLQYADYAAWQRQSLEGAPLQREADYWRATLAGAPSLLELPSDRPRPSQSDHAGSLVDVELDEELTERLRALSKRHGATLFMTLLASWAAVLARLSGQDDLVIGTPVANRGRAELEELVGLVVNTLALRIDLSGSPTVAELLARVRRHVLDAHQHQDIPFEQVVEIVRPSRSLAATPLFQVMFAWQPPSEGTFVLPGVEIGEGIRVAHERSTFDLTLALGEAQERIAGNVEFSTTLFDRATVERYVGYWRALLTAMVEDEHCPVQRLPMLPTEERRLVVEAWNETAADFPRDRCVHELFEARASATPGAIAVIQEERSVTYAELNRAANRLAHLFRDLGARPGERVAICLERSVEMIVAVLAVLKSGAAYIPLDPAQPAERLREVVEDGWPLLFVTQGRLAAIGDSADTIIVDMARPELWARQPDSNLTAWETGLSPFDVMAVIYTSGSTGKPKGVMVGHRAVCNQIAALHKVWDIGADDRVLQFASLAFDVSIEEIFTTLTTGATLVLRTAAWVTDGERFWGLCRSYGITIADLPTRFWQVVCAGGTAIAEGVRLLVIGGEAADRSALEAWLARTARPRLLNAYGPTETTISATLHEPLPGETCWRCIGRPMSNMRAYVLDRERQPVPVGVAGELWIGGAGVARGYWNLPELTAAKFVEDPYAGEPRARMYATGDVARWLADGTLEFLGRTDHQVKIRGFRIELGEIEARLSALQEVLEAAVTVDEQAGEKRLIAYVVPATGMEPGAVTAERLRAQLAQSLPDYMIPSAFVLLGALPLTTNGKLDLAALPSPEENSQTSRDDDDAPAGEIERVVARIWGELLGLERVGRHDHFFELGGHSLLAVQVISRLREELGVEAELTSSFAQPVLREFARSVATMRQSALPAVGPAPAEERSRLSFAQQRIWFLSQLGGASTAYHLASGFRLQGRLDRDVLRRALERVVERHEALRTYFPIAGGEPVARVAAVGEHPFAVIEQELSADAEMERIAAEEAATAFDLERGPLVRARLVRRAEDDHTLLLTQHHIISDGWSTEVLVRELAALYAAFSSGDSDPLPAPVLQYADYAAWQRRWMRGDVLREQGEFWAAQLQGAPALLELPADRPRPPQQDLSGAAIAFELEPRLAAGVRALSRRHGTSVFQTVLASWFAVLARLSGQDDLVVGIPVASRGRRELENVIGLFANTLAVRVDLSGDPGTAELLDRVKTQLLAAQQHQDLPFDQVVEAAKPVRSLAHPPLFQTMVGWQNLSEGTPKFPGLTLSLADPVTTTSKFDLSLSMEERAGSIGGQLVYATALFDASTAERYLGHWTTLLEAMVEDDARSLPELPLLTAEERDRIVHVWNSTDASYPDQLCIQQLFEARVAETPDAIAVVHRAKRLTYAQLNGAANRLAHHLRTLGVGANERVAICLERGVEMVVAVLATLKAGGAYVPLDPAYPAERLRFALRDCDAVAVLADDASLPIVGDVADRIAVLNLDRAEAWDDCPRSNPDAPPTGPRHLAAYLIYTSGSTGIPKGVLVEHPAVVNLLVSMQKMLRVGPADDLLALTTLAFDIATLELLLSLISGARLTVLDRSVAVDGPALARVLSRGEHTIVQATPTTWRMLRDAGWSGSAGRLRALCGGEALPRELADFIGNRVDELWNVYGPTETTIWSSAHETQRDSTESGASEPIGRPVANTRIYILDGRGEPVPIGVAGEIHIGGTGVAREYWKRPELTAEKFIRDPFAGPDARMYRTGDRGRFRTDGSIDFLGRNDDQVKIRGFRIEPGEIEAQLLAHPEVRAAAVIVREAAPGDPKLVAYVVPESPEQAPGAEALRRFLGATLPEWMVPGSFVHLDALPLTLNGKVDRKALPAPASAQPERAYAAPAGAVETVLAGMWMELLAVPRIGRADNFFDLGGHSLLVTKLVLRIRDELGVDVPVADIFMAPQLSAVAERVVDAQLAQFAADDLLSLLREV